MNHRTGRALRRALASPAEDAGWTIREAAWDFEEKVLWPSGDAARDAIAPLQRLIQTRLTWPLSDGLRRRSTRTRALLAASVAAAAIAGAAGGALTASEHPATPHQAASIPATVAAASASAHPVALQGVVPRFQPGHAKPAPPRPPAKTSAPPAQVAWQFAQAFVAYEVGHSNSKTDAIFAQTATKQLSKSLAADPPRLPAEKRVPQARVLNVVLGAPAKNQVTASVSLVRLRAMSEVRLTLTKTGDAWRVAQVLG
jgi:hypothetical protein